MVALNWPRFPRWSLTSKTATAVDADETWVTRRFTVSVVPGTNDGTSTLAFRVQVMVTEARPVPVSLKATSM
jgi:hypothetical protein